MSTLVLAAWPSEASGAYLEGEEAVLEHLLTWPAAKNIFQLQGASETSLGTAKMQLSPDRG